LDDALAEAEDHWRGRTGLTEADDAPEGYVIWDLYGGCMLAYDETGDLGPKAAA
jgi:hypothetical protein